MAREPKDKAPTVKQQAKRIVDITGPIRIRGIHAYDAAGNRVARVGIDLAEDDDA